MTHSTATESRWGDPQWPRNVYRTWVLSVTVGYAMTAIAFWLGFGLGVMMAVAPTLALLSHPRRPAALLPAGLLAISSIWWLTMLGIPMLIVGSIWLWIHHQVADGRRAGIPIIVVPLILWLGAATATVSHFDPSWEGLLISMLAAASVAAGWWLAAPREPALVVDAS